MDPRQEDEIQAMIEHPILCSQELADELTRDFDDSPSIPKNIFENDPFLIDNLFDVFMESDKSMVKEGLSEDSIRLLSMPEKAASCKIYTRY